MAPGLGGVTFFGSVLSAGCDDWGDERVLAQLRGELGLPAQQNFLNSVSGVLTADYAAHIPDGEFDLICEVDVFIPSHESAVWVDFFSVYESLIVSRFLTGGVAEVLGPDFTDFANGEGLVDRFVFLGSDCGQLTCTNFAGVYGSIPDPDYVAPTLPFPTPTPLPGKKTLAGEWFTVRHVVTTEGHHAVWVRDSETMALNDPTPGDDGCATPTLLDDIEDGFAKIFPSGPFGRMRLTDGHISDDPSFPFATTATTVRAFFGAEDTSLPRADRNYFIDNVSIRGHRATTPPAP